MKKIFPKFLFIFLILLIGFSLFKESQKIEANFSIQFLDLKENSNLIFFQNNTLIAISNPTNPEPPVIKKLKVIVTAYSSTPWETDEDPEITAAGTKVREGIVANNLLPIGTKIRIPELFGDKIFIVEDRMNWTKGNYHIDIWFPSYWEALNFGAKKTYIEILES